MSETPPEETGAQKIPPELLTGGILPEDNTSYLILKNFSLISSTGTFSPVHSSKDAAP